MKVVSYEVFPFVVCRASSLVVGDVDTAQRLASYGIDHHDRMVAVALGLCEGGEGKKKNGEVD